MNVYIVVKSGTLLVARRQSPGCFFVPKFWEGGGDLRMIFCPSVNLVRVVSTLIGGGDTRNLIA